MDASVSGNPGTRSMRSRHLAAFVLVTLVPVLSCTSDPIRLARATCETKYHLIPGTATHAACVRAVAENPPNKLQTFGLALEAFGEGACGAGCAVAKPLAKPDKQLASTCLKTGEETSGMNKICYYNCLGSAAAITISSVSLCPLTINQ